MLISHVLHLLHEYGYSQILKTSFRSLWYQGRNTLTDKEGGKRISCFLRAPFFHKDNDAKLQLILVGCLDFF